MAKDTADVEYDPTNPKPPAREPPRRSTVPQSPYTGGQVAVGIAVLLVGLAIIVGFTLALA